jgi:hypothetical protein
MFAVLLCHERTDGWLAGLMFATRGWRSLRKLKLTVLYACAQLLSAPPDALW